MSNRITLGIIILGLGVLWLLANFGLVQFPGFWGIVSVGFIALGAWQIVASNFRELTGGIILLILGSGIGLIQLEIIELSDLARVFWPAIVILVGLSILFQRQGSKKVLKNDSDTRQLNLTYVFSEGKVINTSNDFQGGEIIAIFGEGTVDLRQAEVSNKPAQISSTMLFGGTTLELPDFWIVENRTFSLFGGIDDQRTQAKVTGNDATPDLIITGLVLFGGFEIK